MANREQEVAIVDCILLAPVYAQQVVPDVAPQTALIVTEHARCFGNQLEVNRDLLNEVPVLLLGALSNRAILQWLRIHHHYLLLHVVVCVAVLLILSDLYH